MSGWRVKPLAEVCEYDRSFARNQALPYLGMEQIESGTGRIIGDLAPAETESSSFLFGREHVLFGRLRPYLQKVALPSAPGRCSTEIFPLKPSVEICREFLFYWLLEPGNAAAIDRTSTGARMPRANMNEVARLPIAYPPLPEQKRIVAILDEAFDGIAKATTNAERNIVSARDLFHTCLEQRFANIRKVAPKLSVGAAGRVQTGNTPPAALLGAYGDHVPFVKPADFAPTGELDYENDGLSEVGAEAARVVPAGSALMVCIDATIGKTGYTERDIATNQQINSVTPHKGTLGRFLYYQMRTSDFQSAVQRSASQATLPIINKSKWSALPVWLPNSDLQRQVCDEMDALSEQTANLEAIYRAKVERFSEYRSVVLARAFSGQLTSRAAA